MTDNEVRNIRNAITNFIGALAVSMPFEPRVSKQEIAAILLEEVLRLAQDENGVYDLFILKPLLRSQVAVLRQRNSELAKLSVAVAKEQIAMNDKIIAEFSRLIESLR